MRKRKNKSVLKRMRNNIERKKVKGFKRMKSRTESRKKGERE